MIRSFCWEDDLVFCPKCHGRKVYLLSEQRFRCPRCMYTFHDFSRRWINTGGLSCLQWLDLLRLFQEEATANQMARELSVSYNTAYKALTTVRLAILASALDSKQFLGRDAEIDLGCDWPRAGKQQSGRPFGVPVFGILEKHSLVFVDLMTGLQGETLFHFHLNFHLKMIRIGKLVYTDRYKHYDALIACGDDTLPYRILVGKREKPAIDCTKSGFWDFAKKRLKRYSGITPKRFPLYIKELEFRYNHRDQDILPILLRALCGFVPDRH